MTLYRYTADAAARALWGAHGLKVPWDGRLCMRPEGGAWHMNAVVVFRFPGGRADTVIVPWRRLKVVAR